MMTQTWTWGNGMSKNEQEEDDILGLSAFLKIKKRKKHSIRYHGNRIIIIFAQAKPKLCNAEPTQPLYT